MNVQTFLTNFGHIANAPNGAAKLRETVLSLAMQGKLVEQSPKEQPASELLKKIEVEKERLAAEQGVKAPKQQLDINAQELGYTPPPGWEWVRFGQIAQHNAGKTLDKGRNTGLPRDYITTSNLYWGTFELRGLRQMPIRDDELERCTARKGDLLISEGGEAGRAAVWPYDKEVSFQNHIHRARFYGGIDPYYAYRFFEKLNATGEINRYRKGVGISNMSGKALAAIAIPLPPLAEQKRIVAKVDELMALCDQLEAQQQEREQRFPVLSRASHDRFTEAPTPANLNRIFDEIGTVSPADLRKTILILAVRGKLALQDQKDEAVEDCSKTLAARRLQPISPDELPFRLPGSWKWCRLGCFAELINGDRGKNYPNKAEYVRSGLPFINTGHIEPDGTLSIESMHYITRAKFDSLRSGKIQPGDLVYCLRGATLGKTAIINQFSEGAVASSLVILRLNETLIPRYVYFFLTSPVGRDLIKRFDNGSAQPNLAANSVKRFVIPVPPIAEQRRIVAKVDELLALVGFLEKQQRERDHIAETFAKAVVSSLTGTRVEEEQKMKAPKTQLISILKLGINPKSKDRAPLAMLLIQANGELSAKSLWQQSGLTIDAFYQQLKTELAHGWIAPPQAAEIRAVDTKASTKSQKKGATIGNQFIGVFEP